MEKLKLYYIVRFSGYEMTTDFFEVGKHITTMRMPTDCWVAFRMAEEDGIVAFRRNDYVWIQVPTPMLQCVCHSHSATKQVAVKNYTSKEVYYQTNENEK